MIDMKVFLSLGSNKGNREEYLQNAVRTINKLRKTKVLKSSSIYETESWGNKNLDFFLNQVIMINTELNCIELLRQCQKIEKKYGRVKENQKWQARTLDIDILICDDQKICIKELQVPHPLLPERMFVLKPLSELDPDLVIPGKNKNVIEIMKECNDTSKVQLYK